MTSNIDEQLSKSFASGYQKALSELAEELRRKGISAMLEWAQNNRANAADRETFRTVRNVL